MTTGLPFTKKIKFGNPLDCLIGVNKVNIFDYPASITNTVEGDLQRQTYGSGVLFYMGEEPYTLEFVITQLGGVPDRSALGYSIEYVSISANAQYITVIEDQFTETVYTGHELQMFVSYVGLRSVTQIDSNWLLIDTFYCWIKLKLPD